MEMRSPRQQFLSVLLLLAGPMTTTSCEITQPTRAVCLGSIELREKELVSINGRIGGTAGLSLLLISAGEVKVHLIERKRGAWRQRVLEIPTGKSEYVIPIRGDFRTIVPVMLVGSGGDAAKCRVVLIDSCSGALVGEQASPTPSGALPCAEATQLGTYLWLMLKERPGVWRRLDLTTGVLGKENVRTSPPDGRPAKLTLGRWNDMDCIAYSTVETKTTESGVGIVFSSPNELLRIIGPESVPDRLKARNRHALLVQALSILVVDSESSHAVYVGLPLTLTADNRLGDVAEWSPAGPWKSHAKQGVVGLGQALVYHERSVFALGAREPSNWISDDLDFDFIHEPFADLVCDLKQDRLIPIKRITPPFLFVSAPDGLFVWGKRNGRMTVQLVD